MDYEGPSKCVLSLNCPLLRENQAGTVRSDCPPTSPQIRIE
jgi:hypothetical protein